MYQPIGSACSYGFHESQSRFVENIIGRSSEFWSYYFPELVRMAGESLLGVNPTQLIKAVNAVRPSKIRIDADEVTYSIHVIIRFELERELFAG
jgi:carboxypeptidase Taq